jgi:hypothetical protein
MMVGDIPLAISTDASAPLLIVGTCNQRGLRCEAGSLGHDYSLAALLLCVLAFLRVLSQLSNRLDCALLSLVSHWFRREATQRRTIGGYEFHFISFADVAALYTAAKLIVICIKLEDEWSLFT